MKPEKRLLRPPNPERTPLGLACVWSFISEETKRGVRPHCLSQALHSPLASMSARVCVCVYAQECVCVCVFNALKMVRSLACLVTIPTSLPVFLRVKAPLLSRFLLQLLGRRPALLPARRPPPSRPRLSLPPRVRFRGCRQTDLTSLILRHQCRAPAPPTQTSRFSGNECNSNEDLFFSHTLITRIAEGLWLVTCGLQFKCQNQVRQSHAQTCSLHLHH